MNKKIIVLTLLFFIGVGLIIFLNREKPFECGDKITFIYQGKTVTYGTIESSNTGKCWLDKNLGATQVATSLTDSLAYGDLFQWGRSDDGHQVRDCQDGYKRNSLDCGDNRFIQELAVDIKVNHSKFINKHQDWLLSSNNYLWIETNGIILNNPCPDGWRVPTASEWLLEYDNKIDDGDLKLTLTGYRDQLNGSINFSEEMGGYWSSSVVGENGASNFYLNNDNFGIGSGGKSLGLSVRCIKGINQ